MVDFLLKDDKVIRKGEGYGDAIQQQYISMEISTSASVLFLNIKRRFWILLEKCETNCVLNGGVACEYYFDGSRVQQREKRGLVVSLEAMLDELN